MTSIAKGFSRATTSKEALRVERWWATYNAALTGLCANRSEPKDPRHHEIHLDARLMADIAHGALVLP